jgi:hypothetical protein
MARSVVLRKSNNENLASDVLQLAFRQWELCGSRTKRAYNKKEITGRLRLGIKEERTVE